MSEQMKMDAERAAFETYMLGREHPVFGWISRNWFGRGDNPATYENDYVQGCWVMWQARASLPVGVPDSEWVMHMLEDRWPDSGERVEVEAFADWLREVLAAPTVKAEQVEGLGAEVERMVCALEAGEWAEHAGQTELGARLESAVTTLINRLQAPSLPAAGSAGEGAEVELLKSHLSEAAELLAEAKVLIPDFGGRARMDAWRKRVPEFINRIGYEEKQSPTKQSCGTLCRICGTKLCVKGVCTIYCPNRDCGVPGRGTKALTAPQRERLEGGLPVFDDALSAQQSAPAYGSYTTRPAEAVAGIALRQLGDESRWVEIRDLNAHAFPGIGPHDYYPVGTVLRMPAEQQSAPERVSVPWFVLTELLGRYLRDLRLRTFPDNDEGNHGLRWTAKEIERVESAISKIQGGHAEGGKL